MNLKLSIILGSILIFCANSSMAQIESSNVSILGKKVSEATDTESKFEFEANATDALGSLTISKSLGENRIYINAKGPISKSTGSGDFGGSNGMNNNGTVYTIGFLQFLDYEKKFMAGVSSVQPICESRSNSNFQILAATMHKCQIKKEQELLDSGFDGDADALRTQSIKFCQAKAVKEYEDCKVTVTAGLRALSFKGSENESAERACNHKDPTYRPFELMCGNPETREFETEILKHYKGTISYLRFEGSISPNRYKYSLADTLENKEEAQTTKSFSLGYGWLTNEFKRTEITAIKYEGYKAGAKKYLCQPYEYQDTQINQSSECSDLIIGAPKLSSSVTLAVKHREYFGKNDDYAYSLEIFTKLTTVKNDDGEDVQKSTNGASIPIYIFSNKSKQLQGGIRFDIGDEVVSSFFISKPFEL